MRLDLCLKHSELGICLITLLPSNLLEQFINFDHLIVEALLQQQKLILSLFVYPCVKITILYLPHKSNDDADGARYPIHKNQIEQHCCKDANHNNRNEPFCKCHDFLRQVVP
ncbi:hypothetical protein D3C78_1171290 [compost metagenome]